MTRYDIRLRQMAGTPIAVVRSVVRRADLPAAVQHGCGVVWNFVRENGLNGGRNVAIYWDGSIRLEVGVEVPAAFIASDDVVLSATPAGPAVTTTHIGPYGHLGAAHGAIREWCAAQKLELAGPNWEVYGHWQPEWNADPSQIRTDVFYQIAPALR
jgi:effector-binding domain-containing protein